MKACTLGALLLLLLCNHQVQGANKGAAIAEEGNSKNFQLTDSFPQKVNFIAEDQTNGRRFFPRADVDSNYLKESCPTHTTCSNKTCTLNIPQSFNNTADVNQVFLEPIEFNAGFSRYGAVGLKSSGLRYNSIAIGDIDGDGFPDLVTGEYHDENVQIFLNTQDLRRPFGEPKTLNVTEATNFTSSTIVEVADLDNDGRLDIILAGNFLSDDGIVVLMNKMERGDESPRFDRIFSLPRLLWNVGDIEIADVNNDGCLDLVMCDKYANFIALNTCQSEAPFHLDNILTLPTMPGMPFKFQTDCYVGVADVNNDGWVDVLISSKVTWKLSGMEADLQTVLWMNYDGRFNASEESTHLLDLKGDEYSSFRFGDMNGDGYVDLIAQNYDGQVFLLINKRGEFNESNRERLPGDRYDFSGASIDVGDVNGDGLLDIVMFSSVFTTVALLNRGNDKFTNPITVSSASTSSFGLLADVNNDGMIDIVNPNSVSINAVITFGDGISLPGAQGQTFDVIVKDFDMDGFDDIFVANVGGPYQILFNTGGSLSFSQDFVVDLSDIRDTEVLAWEPVLRTQFFASFAVADVNNDTLPDIAAITRFGNQILLNNGDRSFNSIELKTSCRAEEVALGDMNNDGIVDVVVGCWRCSQGFEIILGGEFNENVSSSPQSTNNRDLRTSLPETVDQSETALFDVDGNDLLDVVILCKGTLFVHKNNGDGSFYETQYNVFDDISIWAKPVLVYIDVDRDGALDILCGYETSTSLFINDGLGNFTKDANFLLENGVKDIKVVDLNGDGYNDIIVARDNEVEVQAGDGDGSFLPVAKTSVGTNVIGIADINQDKQMDIVVGSNVDNSIFLFNACTKGAQIHPKSWCFKCPDYMGKSENPYSVGCVECLPDHMQQPGMGERCDIFPCSKGSRGFGENECENCPDGTFYNSMLTRIENDKSSWEYDRCEICPTGTFADSTTSPKDSCFPCLPGQYQDETKQRLCKRCPVGTYQIEIGSNSSSFCKPCEQGSYQDIEGQTICKLCERGFYQNEKGKVSCIECEEGMYAEFDGAVMCNDCPYPLHSLVPGSHNCSVCMKGFYIVDEEYVGSEMLLQSPRTFCIPCPEHSTDCVPNTSIKNMTVLPGYWRDSIHTSQIYKCNYASACSGTQNSLYCSDGHSGALCEACVNPNQYFNGEDGKCTNCKPSALFFRVIIFFAILVGIVLLSRCVRNRLNVFSNIVLGWSIQAKIKIFVGFFQVMSSLCDVYGISLDDRFRQLWRIFSILGLDFFEMLSFPMECVGTKITSYVLSATLPYMLCAVMILFLWVLRFFKGKIKNESLKRYIEGIAKIGTVQIFVIVFYFALPTVSKSIFDVKTCQAFKTSDATAGIRDDDTYNSYLVSSKNIRCDANDKVFAMLQVLFWVFFVLWPCLTLAVFIGVIAKIRPSVERKRPTSLAVKCRFLWSDFDDTSKIALYWDIIDFIRKLFLTSFVNFFDEAEGSNKILRSTIATAVSSLYLVLLIYTRPYKRRDDFELSIISSFLLVLCFGLGSILKICENNVDSDACKKYVGFGMVNSFGASICFVVLSLAMLMVTVIVFVIQTYKSPVARLKSTGYPPYLELPPSCEQHLFMSHVWKTGQDKCHSIARKLQLFMPGLKIWLDVDDLSDTGDLEKCVGTSALILIFYSEGYFQSRNCRREFFQALILNKPLVLVFDGDDTTIQKMKNECAGCCGADSIAQFCSENNSVSSAKLDELIQSFLVECDKGDILIQWLKIGSFSSESLKLIYLRILEILPRYQESAYKDLLKNGLSLPGDEPAPLFASDVTIIVSEVNYGAPELARELEAMEKGKITICEIQRDFDKPALGKSTTADTISQDQKLASELERMEKGKMSICKIKKDFNKSPSDNNTAVDTISQDPKRILQKSAVPNPLPHTVDHSSNDVPCMTDNASLSVALIPNHEDGDPRDRALSNHVSKIESGLGGNLHVSNQSFSSSHKKVLLLYLNKQTFADENKKTITDVIQSAQGENVPILLVQEQDIKKDAACDFGYFFEHTPIELIPGELYSEIAVPLFTRQEYRNISLSKILQVIAKKIKDQ